VGDGGVGRRGIEAGAVGLARGDGLSHGVVDLEDDAFGAILAVCGLVMAADDGEGVHDVGDVVAGDAVEMEVGRVQLAAEEEAAVFVPAVGREQRIASGE